MPVTPGVRPPDRPARPCHRTGVRGRRRCAGSAAAPPAASGTRSASAPVRVRRPAGRRPRPAPAAVAAAPRSRPTAARPLPTGVSELDRVLGRRRGRRLGDPPLRAAGHRQVHPAVPGALVGGRHRRRRACWPRPRSRSAQVSGRAARIGRRCPRTSSALEGPDVEAIEAAVERHRPALVVVDSLQSVSDPELAQPAGQPGPGARLRGAPDPPGQVDRRPAPPGGPRDQGRRPGRAPGGRAPRRHRAVLRRGPPPRPAGPDLGQAPLRADRRGRHLRDARRRPARRARPRPAAAGGPHGRRAGQRGGAGPAGPAPAAGRGAGAARPGHRQRWRRASRPRPSASTRPGPNLLLAVLACRTAVDVRRRPSSSWPPWAASPSPSRRPTWRWRWPWPRRRRPPLPADLVVFGELAWPARSARSRARTAAWPRRSGPGSPGRWCRPRRSATAARRRARPASWSTACARWPRRSSWPARRPGPQTGPGTMPGWSTVPAAASR